MEKIDWGKRVVRLEKYLNVTKDELAEKLGVPVREVEEWEKGKVPRIRDQYAMKALRKERKIEKADEQKNAKPEEKIIVKEIVKEVQKPRFNKNETALLKEILSKELGAGKDRARDDLIKTIWQKL